MNKEVIELIEKHLEGDDRAIETAKFAFKRQGGFVSNAILAQAAKLTQSSEEVQGQAQVLMTMPSAIAVLLTGYSKGWETASKLGEDIIKTEAPSDEEKKFIKFLIKSAKNGEAHG